MARPKYQITSDDYFTARKWIDGKIKKHQLEFKGANDFMTAAEELEKIPYRHKVAKKAVEELQAWCEKYMSDRAWQQMKTTIRADRMRSSQQHGDKKQITLTNKAWCMLSTLSETENATLSQVIEKHLYKQYMKAIETDAGLQVDLLK